MSCQRRVRCFRPSVIGAGIRPESPGGSPSLTSPGIRLVEIAELLGVTKQRTDQIAEEKGFPEAEEAGDCRRASTSLAPSGAP